MSFGLLYWILMILWLLFGLGLHFGLVAASFAFGGTLLLFILFVLLGWKVFGPPLRP